MIDVNDKQKESYRRFNQQLLDAIALDAGPCPKCQGKMTVIEGKKGVSWFYRCMSYPVCKESVPYKPSVHNKGR